MQERTLLNAPIAGLSWFEHHSWRDRFSSRSQPSVLQRKPISSWSLLTVSSLLVIVLALGLPVGAQAGSASARGTTCGTVAGPTVHRTGETIRRYTAVAHAGVDCGFARTWTAKLVNRKWPNGVVPHAAGAPAGWTCFLTEVVDHVAVVGACQKGTSGFGWGAGA